MGKGFEEYSATVGKILANLQALELLLRRFLYEKQDAPHAPLQTPLNVVKVGDYVPENAATDWSRLGDLIKRYNKRVAWTRKDLVVDPGIVAVRDALAHGRVWLPNWDVDADAPPILLRFRKPKDGKVAVESLEVMSGAWLEATIASTSAQTEKVAVAYAEL